MNLQSSGRGQEEALREKHGRNNKNLFSLSLSLSLSLLFRLICFTYGYFACMYAYAPCTCLVPREGQKRTSDPLELELQMVLSARKHHVRARN